MVKIYYWFKSFNKIETINDAELMGLKFITNVHGDGINIYNCRSFWEDKYGNNYRCDGLFDTKNIDLHIRKLKLKKIINKVNG